MSSFHSPSLLAAAATAALALPGAAVRGGVEYTVTPMPGPPDAFSVVPWGLDAGDVVGWVQQSGQPIRAFLYTDAAGFVVLPAPPGESSYIGREISDTGVVAGGSEFSQPWTLDGGEYNLLPLPPETATAECWGVNDTGDAAGTADPASFLNYQAFFYNAETDTTVQVAPWPSRAWDVNNAGVVSGALNNVAFRWTQTGGLESLGPLNSTYTLTFGFAINESGHVAGLADDPTNSNNSRGFLFTDESGMQMIPPLGLINQAWGLNDFGVVVGTTEKTGGGDLGWVWTASTGTRDLTDLIDPAENMAIITAYDVNDAGQIIGLGFDNDIPDFVPVRLDPVDGGIPGDLDGDGSVGTTDFLMLLAAWGPCEEPCPPSCAADLTGDCTVGTEDLLLLLANWGG